MACAHSPAILMFASCEGPCAVVLELGHVLVGRCLFRERMVAPVCVCAAAKEKSLIARNESGRAHERKDTSKGCGGSKAYWPYSPRRTAAWISEGVNTPLPLSKQPRSRQPRASNVHPEASIASLFFSGNPPLNTLVTQTRQAIQIRSLITSHSNVRKRHNRQGIAGCVLNAP
jgi:hypothetical protein